eukprot:gnl/Spiro4/2495_TR1201_c0_g2_i1.p1 gnl/Spiro4/2495_TR1201_c0_g2~~gnl/Spiro4/2495_TR1201_c0_g2_i1.p1  ORF type:complete len:418 (-),score=116.20 gnl/Spiro4/2495_TR1201_c0_g2_i1:148-1305(-)
MASQTRRNTRLAVDENQQRRPTRMEVVDKNLPPQPAPERPRPVLSEITNLQCTESELEQRRPRKVTQAQQQLQPVVVQPATQQQAQQQMPLHQLAFEQPRALLPDIAPMEVDVGPQDIDAGDEVNPQLCTHYVNDIYQHLSMTESLRQPNRNYLENVQEDINATMRAILVDWLVEVAEEYKLSSDTLYLTINYIDRYLSVTPVRRNKLQLVGVTCCLIAAKYEEIYAPAVDDFVYISDNTYTREEIIKMESHVLNTLEFNLTCPTAKLFLRRFIKAALADAGTAMLSSYLCELTLQDYRFLRFLPSMVAASAVSVALASWGRPAWNPTLEYYTGYSQMDILPCVQDILDVFTASPDNNLQAVREKYSQPRFMCVGLRTPPACYPK